MLLFPAVFVCAVWSTVSGSAVLEASLTAEPGIVQAGDVVTVRMLVSNTGDTGVYNGFPVPTTPTTTGGVSVMLISGPNPTLIATLYALSSMEFTWTYQMITAGTAVFSCSAQGTEQGTGNTITSQPALSNPVTVFLSATPTYTFTATASVTLSPTNTPSPATPTRTSTATASVTPTPAATPSSVNARIASGSIINPLQGETTTIAYELNREEEVKIIVFDRKGKLIKTLVLEKKKASIYTTVWDGSFEDGSKVGEGIYIIRVKIGGYARNLKAAVKQ